MQANTARSVADRVAAPTLVDTHLPAVSLGLDGRLLEVNDALCALVGRRRRQLVGRNLRSLTAYPTDAVAGQRALAAARAGTPCGTFVQRWQAKGGRPPRRVRLVWTLLRGHHGVPVSLMVFCLDESQETAAAASVARSGAHFEHSPVPQVLCDAAGVLTDVNAAFCRLLGRPATQLVGRPARDLLHRTDPGGLDAELASLLGGAEVAEAERILARPDGRPVSALVSATLLRDEAGNPTGAAMSVQDLGGLRRVERRRERQEDFFLALAQRAGDLAFVVDPTGLVLYASPALAELLGYPTEDLGGIASTELVHHDDVAAATALFDRVLHEGGTGTLTLRVGDAGGRWRWMESTTSNLLDTPVGGMLWNLRDVDDRVRAEAALRASESRYRAIADNADEGLWVFAPDERTVYVNNRLLEILGIGADAIHERPLLDVLDPERRLREAEQPTGEGRRSERYEVGYEHPDGRRRTLLVSAAPLDDVGGTVEGSLALVIDVTDARRLEDELRRAALHDTLTGLPNRALLLDRLQHALTRETRSTAVLFVDLDQFKSVNDIWGHAAGDELLVRVATRLRENAHPTDTVARFAGDEFLVVCEDVDVDSARLLAEGLLAALDEPFQVSEGEIHLTASIGVALSPATSAGSLLNQADTAMYAAKMAGRHRVQVFDTGLAARVGERYELGGDLRVALADDRLDLHHQPVIDLSTGRVVGTEALARWTHPVRGQVSPDRFVPIAEEVGLAPDLDRWALRRALRDTLTLRESGALAPDGHVAVNFSAHTLSDPALAGWIARTVEESGIDPRHVLIEVTESAIMADATAAVGVLSRLRDQGFGVAVDDFGTGHSSLAYLRNLPLTTLKIDRSFVTEIATDSSALAIVSSIVELARAVGLTVVAEGVETPQHARLLQELGCEAAQGWLWSPAVSTDEARRSGALTRTYDVAGSPVRGSGG
jgi:diguanylate cyclase (GGDEF)-like protein/PAS domain S-box-containing protein